MLPKLNGETVASEQKLLSNFIKADSETLLYFYDTYLPGVTKYICNNNGGEADARDVFQEALLVLYKQAKSGNFQLSASLKTYIFSICRFQWLKHIRKNKRIEAMSEGVELIDLSSDTVKVLENAEKYVLLQSHLAKLNPTAQQIMDLHFQKHSTDQIAEVLGLSKGYVKKRKYELKKELIIAIRDDLRYNELK